MTVAKRTREAVRARPFLQDALAAGVVNYAAAAESLDVDAGSEAIAAALRRYESELAHDASGSTGEPSGSVQGSESPQASPASARVRLQRGLERVELGGGDADDPLVAVGGTGYRVDAGELAAVTARGDAIGATDLERVLGRLRTAEIGVEVAAVGSSTLVVVVPGRVSADALRLTESVFE